MLTLMPAMVCAYAAFAMVAALALRWRHPARHLADSTQGATPTVTVIVAARNEQADLPRCIAALEALEYPKNLLEVLLVDDESTDNTKCIIADAAARNAHFRALSTAGFISPLRVKARPLDCAAREAQGDWLLITDADGAVRPGWVRQLMAAVQPNTGILCGSVIAQPQRTIASRIESLVTAFLMGMSFGLEALGAEPVCTGPNMAIRRRVYVASGGLEAANFFVAEDAALWRLSHKQGMRSRGVCGGEALVTVIPTPSFAALVSQHRRWLGGGFHDGPRLLKLIVAAVTAYAWLGSVYTVAGLFAPTWPWAFAVTLRALADYALIDAARVRFQANIPRAWFVLLELYLIAGFALLPAALLIAPTLVWRGHGYVEHLRPHAGPTARAPEHLQTEESSAA